MEYRPEKSNVESRHHNSGWILGRIYFDKEDKRIIVKRPRSGFGYTMNLGNKWTWALNFFVIFVILAVVIAANV